MTHPLVKQLRFTRSEWLRALEGITGEEAQRRFLPMNCISWIIGHLAWQEQRYWIYRPQSRFVVPGLDELTGFGSQPSTPPLADMWEAWRTVIQEADTFLDTLETEALSTHLTLDGQLDDETIGTRLQRVIYHYWFHIGEIMSIRQMLGHTDLPQFVGDIQEYGPYQPEP